MRASDQISLQIRLHAEVAYPELQLSASSVLQNPEDLSDKTTAVVGRAGLLRGFVQFCGRLKSRRP